MVAVNLPLERPTIEGVAEIFSACGEIVLIRQEWLRFNIDGPKVKVKSQNQIHRKLKYSICC